MLSSHHRSDLHTYTARPNTSDRLLRIPYLDEPAFQWFESFDPLGDLLPHPNPSSALDMLERVLRYLTQELAWPPGNIHFLGFAQGGSVAGELALRWWRAHRPIALGSIVSVSGPLLSYPNTLPEPCATPALYFHRNAPSSEWGAFKKGFSGITEVKKVGQEGMPRSRDEWEPIMHFWSERLSRRKAEGLYEVMTGAAG